MAAGPINLFEFEDLARDRMGLEQYDHIAGGATDEISIRRARGIFDSMMLRPRVLVDITKRDLSTTALGHRIGFPVMLAPAGMHGRAHPQAELASVRAAGALGTVMVVSTGANFKLEEVAKAATGPIWFQQSLYRDREFTRSMAERAHAAGYTAICITVDSTLPAKDERDIRHKYRNRPSPNYAGAEPETKALRGPLRPRRVPRAEGHWSYLGLPGLAGFQHTSAHSRQEYNDAPGCPAFGSTRGQGSDSLQPRWTPTGY